MADMLIKKLSKLEIKEGLTLELVNTINLAVKSSPVIFKIGDDPVELCKCSNGYWVVYTENDQDKFLSDDKNNLIVFSERECQIARARYLLHHIDEEKKAEAEKLLHRRKTKVKSKLDSIKANIERYTQIKNGTGLWGAIYKHEVGISDHDQEIIDNLDHYLTLHKELELLYEEDKIIQLLQILNIESFENPIMTVNYDDEKGMDLMKSVFGKKALDEWDGDMNKLYANIDVSKKYSSLTILM